LTLAPNLQSLEQMSTIATFIEELEVRWLTSLAEIDAFQQHWQALDAISVAELVWFQSFIWCRNWIASHAGPKVEPRVLTVSQAGKAVAILPLAIERGPFGVKALEVLGQPHTQYGNILTETGKLSTDVVTTLRKALFGLAEADAAIFNYVPEASPLAQVLLGVAPCARLANTASMLDLTGFVDGQRFEATRSLHAQKRLRRHIRLFEKEFDGLAMQALRPGDADYAEMIQLCVTMKREWLAATGRMGGGLTRFDHASFLASLPMITPNDGPIVWVMRGARRVLAVETGFIQRGHYYCYISGFDNTLWKLSPGKLQKAMTINGLIEMRAKTFDLMGNTTEYKNDYANRTVALSGAVINFTARGKLFTSAWTENMEPTLRKLFYRLPNGWRQHIAAARSLSFSSAPP
jgi:CelD/BcsL family acetyltransferase involved in cellulose biosynthesis